MASAINTLAVQVVMDSTGKGLAGQRFTVDINESTTVAALKSLIADKKDIDPKTITMRGHKDDEDVIDFAVEQVVHVILRLPPVLDA